MARWFGKGEHLKLWKQWFRTKIVLQQSAFLPNHCWHEARPAFGRQNKRLWQKMLQEELFNISDWQEWSSQNRETWFFSVDALAWKCPYKGKVWKYPESTLFTERQDVLSYSQDPGKAEFAQISQMITTWLCTIQEHQNPSQISIPGDAVKLPTLPGSN